MRKKIFASGETTLIFWSTGETAKKGRSVAKIKIVLFDSQGLYFLKNNILQSKHRKNPQQFIIYYNNDKCFVGFGYLYKFVMFCLFFSKKQKIID